MGGISRFGSTAVVWHAQAVGAVGDFQFPVRRIVVADQAATIRPDDNCRELADIVLALDDCMGRSLTLNIGTMGNS